MAEVESYLEYLWPLLKGRTFLLKVTACPPHSAPGFVVGLPETVGDPLEVGLNRPRERVNTSGRMSMNIKPAKPIPVSWIRGSGSSSLPPLWWPES